MQYILMEGKDCGDGSWRYTLVAMDKSHSVPELVIRVQQIPEQYLNTAIGVDLKLKVLLPILVTKEEP